MSISQASEWPQSKDGKCARVLDHDEADIYSLNYCEDRILRIEVNPEIPEEELPELVKRMESGEMLLNPAIRPVVRRMLDRADEIDRQRAS